MIPYPISWVDEERDCSSWLGNVLQQEAFRKINEIGHIVIKCVIRIIVRAKASLSHMLCTHIIEMVTALQIVPVLKCGIPGEYRE